MLAQLVAEYPQSPLVEQALYDRARIVYQGRAWAQARKHIEQLLGLSPRRLAEQDRYLECRTAIATHDEGAAACLDAYRRAYPRSPHAATALATLVQLDFEAGGCPRAAARIAELVRQERVHAAAAHARGWPGRARDPAVRCVTEETATASRRT